MPTCLITGANRGLGLEYARQYAADGWKVIATCRQPENADALNQLNGNVEVHGLDVTDFSEIEALTAKLKGVAIDLLINNAGIYGPRVVPFKAVDYGTWAEVMRVNTMAPLKICAAFVPHVAASSQKRMVAMTSRMGSIADNSSGGVYIYRTSKAALNAAMRSLAIDLRSFEIVVALLHPGWVRTDMGGAGAKIDARESVASLRTIIAHLDMEKSGRFYNYDGQELPW